MDTIDKWTNKVLLIVGGNFYNSNVEEYEFTTNDADKYVLVIVCDSKLEDYCTLEDINKITNGKFLYKIIEYPPQHTLQNKELAEKHLKPCNICSKIGLSPT